MKDIRDIRAVNASGADLATGIDTDDTWIAHVTPDSVGDPDGFWAVVRNDPYI